MKFGICILFSLLIFSCSEKKEEIPTDVLTKDKFILALVEMYGIEGKYSHANVIDKPVFEKGVKEYEDLFKKMGITKKQIENSIDYYMHQPEMMKEIQAVVLDSLNSRSKKYEK